MKLNLKTAPEQERGSKQTAPEQERGRKQIYKEKLTKIHHMNESCENCEEIRKETI